MLNKLMEETLFEMIETTIFNKEGLQDIKESTKLFKLPNDQKKELLKSFLFYLNRIYEEMTEKLPFFFEHLLIQQELLEYSDSEEKLSNSEQSLRIKLENREEVLSLIGARLQRIFKKLE
ncbi:MAG: hypothetical protein GF317_13290 [Candidatus Lokiarchaeota archaeon]|nr:hypothetical protein [Candidatus Lokiarchaeota archaeon]MBD3200611.1 hypothetical protein [Candidatus Lokiarchaeota archaeon]